MNRAALPLLLFLTGPAASCARRPSVFFAPQAEPQRVYVRLAEIEQLHPLTRGHAPSVTRIRVGAEGNVGTPTDVHGDKSGLSEIAVPIPPFTDAAPTEDPAPSDPGKHRASVQSRYARARARKLAVPEYLIEEEAPRRRQIQQERRDLLRRALEERNEADRRTTTERIVRLREKTLTRYAFETPAALRQRVRDAEAEIDRERAALDQLLRERQAAMEAELRKLNEGQDVVSVRQQPGKAAPAGVGDEARYAQRLHDLEKKLENDWKLPPPLRPLPGSGRPVPETVRPQYDAPREPGTRPRPGLPPRGVDPADYRHVILEDSRNLVRQWAHLHQHQLVSFTRARGARDMTTACAAWVRQMWAAAYDEHTAYSDLRKKK